MRSTSCSKRESSSSNLITYMDGKTGAEELVSKLLQDPALLQTLATTKNPRTSS